MVAWLFAYLSCAGTRLCTEACLAASGAHLSLNMGEMRMSDRRRRTLQGLEGRAAICFSLSEKEGLLALVSYKSA
jgi:hypothetical protein